MLRFQVWIKSFKLMYLWLPECHLIHGLRTLCLLGQGRDNSLSGHMRPLILISAGPVEFTCSALTKRVVKSTALPVVCSILHKY
jgi:hypothetical protein